MVTNKFILKRYQHLIPQNINDVIEKEGKISTKAYENTIQNAISRDCTGASSKHVGRLCLW